MPKKKMPKQKYPRGTLVKIADDLGESMRHFDSGCEAIVDSTYGEAYGGPNRSDYSLVLLDNDRKPINRVAWYEEWQLTAVDDTEWDRPALSKGELLLADF